MSGATRGGHHDAAYGSRTAAAGSRQPPAASAAASQPNNTSFTTAGKGGGGAASAVQPDCKVPRGNGPHHSQSSKPKEKGERCGVNSNLNHEHGQGQPRTTAGPSAQGTTLSDTRQHPVAVSGRQGEESSGEDRKINGFQHSVGGLLSNNSSSAASAQSKMYKQHPQHKHDNAKVDSHSSETRDAVPVGGTRGERAGPDISTRPTPHADQVQAQQMNQAVNVCSNKPPSNTATDSANTAGQQHQQIHPSEAPPPQIPPDSVPHYVFLDATALIQMIDFFQQDQAAPISFPGLLALCRRGYFSNPTAQEEGEKVIFITPGTSLAEVEHLLENKQPLQEQFREAQKILDEITKYQILEKLIVDENLSVFNEKVKEQAAWAKVSMNILHSIDFACLWSMAVRDKCPSPDDSLCRTVFVTGDQKVHKFIQRLAKDSECEGHMDHLCSVTLSELNSGLRSAAPWIVKLLERKDDIVLKPRPEDCLTGTLFRSVVMNIVGNGHRGGQQETRAGPRPGYVPRVNAAPPPVGANGGHAAPPQQGSSGAGPGSNAPAPPPSGCHISDKMLSMLPSSGVIMSVSEIEEKMVAQQSQQMKQVGGAFQAATTWGQSTVTMNGGGGGVSYEMPSSEGIPNSRGGGGEQKPPPVPMSGYPSHVEQFDHEGRTVRSLMLQQSLIDAISLVDELSHRLRIQEGDRLGEDCLRRCHDKLLQWRNLLNEAHKHND
eukprot:GHVN01001963.1.p1 GENE.GHVN01001963.1~~GHVN01001963.1.p1  ORF type:complete len:717 (-),score=112.57 GHVN01001963.1:1444-3594(-)